MPGAKIAGAASEITADMARIVGNLVRGGGLPIAGGDPTGGGRRVLAPTAPNVITGAPWPIADVFRLISDVFRPIADVSRPITAVGRSNDLPLPAGPPAGRARAGIAMRVRVEIAPRRPPIGQVAAVDLRRPDSIGNLEGRIPTTLPAGDARATIGPTPIGRTPTVAQGLTVGQGLTGSLRVPSTGDQRRQSVAATATLAGRQIVVGPSVATPIASPARGNMARREVIWASLKIVTREATPSATTTPATTEPTSRHPI